MKIDSNYVAKYSFHLIDYLP